MFHPLTPFCRLMFFLTRACNRSHAASLAGQGQTVALLDNIHAYYAQFQPHIAAAIQTSLSPINKHLQARQPDRIRSLVSY